VTRNSRDFAPLLREWAEADRHHAGCILIWTLGHHEFGAIIKGVDRLLHDRPDADQWRHLAVALEDRAAVHHTAADVVPAWRGRPVGATAAPRWRGRYGAVAVDDRVHV